jgi:hypothetical protein
MAQDLDRAIANAGADSMPLVDPGAGLPTDRLPSVIPAVAATVPMASAARRRPGWVPWALVAALGIIVLVAVALWPRCVDPPAAQQQPTGPPASTAAPPATPAATTQPTQPQGELPAALANLAQVIIAGQQQGMVDNSAQDLLKQAEEVLRAADEGKAEDVDKKLQHLHRKTDEQIDKGQDPWPGRSPGPPGGRPVQPVGPLQVVVESRAARREQRSAHVTTPAEVAARPFLGPSLETSRIDLMQLGADPVTGMQMVHQLLAV